MKLETRLNSEQLERVFSILISIGWHRARKKDVSKIIQEYERRGWYVFQSAIEIMESFDGLPFLDVPGTDSILMSSNYQYEYMNVASEWKYFRGESIFPIGSQDTLDIYVEESGIIYGDAENSGAMGLYGYDIFEGLYNLMFSGYIEKYDYPT
ncbi:SUKH-3 domain-containing protein [Deinococcus ruber]|nr:SUKH-3 domain-containing protein [Deinococcus ruber]